MVIVLILWVNINAQNWTDLWNMVGQSIDSQLFRILLQSVESRGPILVNSILFNKRTTEYLVFINREKVPLYMHRYTNFDTQSQKD